MLGKPKKDLIKIQYSVAFDSDALIAEHGDFVFDGSPARFTLKASNPTGCGNNPVSGNFGGIRVIAHGLPDALIGPGTKRMGELLVGRHSASGNFSQHIVGFFGKRFHFHLFGACIRLSGIMGFWEV